MEVPVQVEEEDKLMGFSDIGEFVRRLNHTNGTDEFLEIQDGLDSGENGLNSRNQEESTVFFAIHPVSVIAVSMIILVIVFFILYSTNRLKVVYKSFKNHNKKLNLLLFSGDHRLLRKSSPSLTSSSYDKSFSSSSGSNSSIGLIRQRTLSDQIELYGKIEPGSFGRVSICNYRSQAHACRVYKELEQNLWSHEIEIQSQLRNSEVVGMLAADIREDPDLATTRFLIITDYFHHGSLHQFLKTHQVDEVNMVNLVYSIARGLNYLHTIMLGDPVKPTIVHLNLKSRNIMVADCGTTCLISDFVSACSYDVNRQTSESPKPLSNCNSDSLLYRAPELLANNQVPTDSKSALACDIYSFALVIWEIASRSILPGTAEPVNGVKYQLPFEAELGNQIPTQQLMYQLVHLNKVRPKITDKWSTSTTLTKIYQILNESWTSLPSSRLTALRIMKDLDNLRRNLIPKESKTSLISIETV